MNQGIREVKIIKPTVNQNSTDKLRVAAYCRVSTDSKDQMNSFYAQMKYYSDFIRRNPKMMLVDIYADEGITGTEVKKRTEFQRMMKDCQNRKIDRVFVKSITRFARNSLECIEAVRMMAEYGVSVFFENDNIDTLTMNSEMMLYIKSAFAQCEALSASKRMKTSIRMKMESGTFVTSTPAYGYRNENKELVIVPEEAEVVKKIFAYYLSGIGIESIVALLNKNGDGGRTDWTISNIRYILSNERYIGDMLMQKNYTPSELPLRSHKNRGSVPQYYCSNSHEAIISHKDFDAVQALRKQRIEKNPIQQKTIPTPFQKKFYCRHCGWRYRLVRSYDQPRWCCSKKGRAGNKCECPSYLTEEVQGAFVHMYNRLRQNEKVLLDDTICQLENLKSRINAGNTKIREIDDEIFTIAEQINKYSQLHAKGILDTVTYHERTDSMQRKISVLRVRHNKLINEDENEKCIEELRRLKRMLSKMSSFLQSYNQSVFDRLVTKIYAESDGTLTFSLPGGLQLKTEVK